MDPTITVAIIGAVAVIVAAAIPFLKKKQGGDTESTNGGNVRVGTITAGGDALVAGRDLHVQQTIAAERFISKNGGRLIIAASKEIITSEPLRQKWSSFDAKFLQECLKDGPRGMIFDGEAFQRFRNPENDEMFGLGVRVYTACCKKIAESDSDYEAFNRIAQVYLSARVVLRQQT